MRISPPPRITLRIGDKDFIYSLVSGNDVLPRQKTRFRNILSRIVAENHKKLIQDRLDYNEQLLLLSEEWTEAQFYLVRGVSLHIVAYAKSELEKAGLSFKK